MFCPFSIIFVISHKSVSTKTYYTTQQWTHTTWERENYRFYVLFELDMSSCSIHNVQLQKKMEKIHPSAEERLKMEFWPKKKLFYILIAFRCPLQHLMLSNWLLSRDYHRAARALQPRRNKKRNGHGEQIQTIINWVLLNWNFILIEFLLSAASQANSTTNQSYSRRSCRRYLLILRHSLHILR